MLNEDMFPKILFLCSTFIILNSHHVQRGRRFRPPRDNAVKSQDLESTNAESVEQAFIQHSEFCIRHSYRIALSIFFASSFSSVTRTSVVNIKPAMLAALCSATRETFAGSMMPAFTMSVNSPLRTS